MPCIRKCLHDSMVSNGNGSMSPLIGTAHKSTTFTDTVHITHLCMTMKLHTFIYSSVFSLFSEKCRNQFHSIHTADFYLSVISIIHCHTFDTNKSFLFHLRRKLFFCIFIPQENFYCNTVCKVCNLQRNNKLTCPGFPVIHSHNLTFYNGLAGSLKHIT